MNWLYFLLAAFLACAAFVLGAGIGYNQGHIEQIPEAQALLDQVAAERRRNRNLLASNRRITETL
jgi:hypothetical protein